MGKEERLAEAEGAGKVGRDGQAGGWAGGYTGSREGRRLERKNRNMELSDCPTDKKTRLEP